MLDSTDIHEMILTVVYSFIGLLVFGAFFVIVIKSAPFSVLKEIEEDQNIALAILMGAVMIGLALIISAAISSP